MYNLKDVWLQAEADPMAVKQKYGNHETITAVDRDWETHIF